VLLDVGWDADVAAGAPAEAAPAGARLVAFDLAGVDRHAAVAEEVFAAFGALDCLVNNAGVQVAVRGDLLDVTPGSFDRVLGINLRGTFFFTQAIARRMLAQPEGPHHRSIVTISSINAVQPAPDRAEYCLSKTGLAMMNQLFALRLAQAGISTYEVRPGIIRTGMTAPVAGRYDALIAGGISPIARWGEPGDVGATVAALAGGRLPFSTGQSLNVDGGLHIHAIRAQPPER
jgi:NAD(P)-dependent dehydrogenase (short-subunit alcohol dehydrogenase family)